MSFCLLENKHCGFNAVQRHLICFLIKEKHDGCLASLHFFWNSWVVRALSRDRRKAVHAVENPKSHLYSLKLTTLNVLPVLI